MSLESTIKARAAMLCACRDFFAKRGVLEVDCAAIRPFAPIDSNIDVMSVEIGPGTKGYLHTSPEYAMKELLAAGSKDIYFLGKVYRYGESGRIHSPQFTMVEWYRLNFSLDEMIQETADFLALFLGHLPLRKMGYREAFQTYLRLDYKKASQEELIAAAIPFHPSADAANWPRDTLIHFLLSHAIEPNLGNNELTALIDYPPHEAALARVIERNGEPVAERFEIYHRGIELCNGYHELPDSKEMRRRFSEENNKRIEAGKQSYEFDEPFLSALDQIPDCCGVSVGFDRAFMLRSTP